MSSKKTRRLKAVRERARKRRKRQQIRQTATIGVVALLIAAGIYMSVDKKPATVDFDYKPEDIVYNQPVHAIHEMNGPTLSAIPFLPKDGPQPKIAVSETTYNFGSIGAKDVVQYDFVIANIGDAPLTISRAYTTCGCTTADFTSTIIPPGKVIIMTLTLDAGFHDVSGQTVRRGVMIENNDPTNPQLEIWVTVTVKKAP
jgi:hypothetical protein